VVIDGEVHDSAAASAEESYQLETTSVDQPAAEVRHVVGHRFKSHCDEYDSRYLCRTQEG